MVVLNKNQLVDTNYGVIDFKLGLRYLVKFSLPVIKSRSFFCNFFGLRFHVNREPILLGRLHLRRRRLSESLLALHVNGTHASILVLHEEIFYELALLIVVYQIHAAVLPITRIPQQILHDIITAIVLALTGYTFLPKVNGAHALGGRGSYSLASQVEVMVD